MQNQRFRAFLEKANPNSNSEHRNTRLLVFDPGETTGVACFDYAKVIFANQFFTQDRTQFPRQFKALLDKLRPTFILYEEYRVYSWRRDQHAWADLHTPKLIGAIEALCTIHGLPSHSQMAHQAKQFCTDDKLKEWGLYTPSLKHARDAIRHGCYFLLRNEQSLI